MSNAQSLLVYEMTYPLSKTPKSLSSSLLSELELEVLFHFKASAILCFCIDLNFDKGLKLYLF